MGWFNKKEGKEEKGIPLLPKLPELPKMEDDKIDYPNEPIHQLPSFPNNSLGERFSQNAIKDAITGKEEGEEESVPDDFAHDRMRMMEEPLRAPLTKEIPERFKGTSKKVKKQGPVFIRIDKFEESLQIFEETKRKISEMEKILTEIKEIKDEEEKELNSWENEIQQVKKQIEKVDQEIFSRLE
jgi:hypothetical protein